MLEGEAESVDGASDEIGQAQQALWGYPDYGGTVSSCSDPTGTDSVLAALAVATAKELRRWQPTKDFYVTNGTLQLTATGKQRCADGLCKNTQALTVTIDPTYGLNEGGTTTAGSCCAACTKFSTSDVLGQCCSCNGTKSYKRSSFSASVYLCQ